MGDAIILREAILKEIGTIKAVEAGVLDSPMSINIRARGKHTEVNEEQ